MAEKVELDWSSADVTDGTLEVALSTRPPKKWREAFERATALLSHGTWNTMINQRKATVRVGTVTPGSEERVHQFLEGAVLEANHAIVSEDELFESDEEGDSDEPETSEDDEMTQRFRTFAAH
jgi:hypothetical protein